MGPTEYLGGGEIIRTQCARVKENVHTICPAFDAHLPDGIRSMVHNEVASLTPVSSAWGPRSSHTYTEPGDIKLRSSVSSLRVTIGRMPVRTAWKMTLASEGDRMRMPVQVARCIVEDPGTNGRNW